jgi:hypothetical protein
MSGAGTGAGLMGFFGGLLDQSPLARVLMNAGRSGLQAARTGREFDDEAQKLDLGEAFLGVGPSFGYAPQSAPTALSASGARARDAQMPGGAARLMGPLPGPSGVFKDSEIEQMLMDINDPFGRIG